MKNKSTPKAKDLANKIPDVELGSDLRFAKTTKKSYDGKRVDTPFLADEFGKMQPDNTYYLIQLLAICKRKKVNVEDMLIWLEENYAVKKKAESKYQSSKEHQNYNQVAPYLERRRNQKLGIPDKK